MGKIEINRLEAVGFVLIGSCSSNASSIISKENILKISIVGVLQFKFDIIIKKIKIYI
jgi:hypothetical protein